MEQLQGVQQRSNWKSECLESLYFKEMDSRQQHMGEKLSGTCEWLLQHKKYQGWLEQTHGLLWIMGKPGSGKSTLMKYALEIEESKRTHVVASFFFSRSGVPMQRRALGLFRSLLHQLLAHNPQLLAEFLPNFQRKLEMERRLGKECEWQTEELQKFFKSNIIPNGYRVRIFVDALDECEDTASKLVEYFQTLTTFPQSNLSICFSCRHFPSIGPIGDEQTISVEHHNEGDISMYIGKKLRPSFESQKQKVDNIEKEISTKASGSFKWVELAVERTLEFQKLGKPVKHILQMLLETPPALDEVYRKILEGIDKRERPQALCLMQWVCMAKRPLSLTELRYAMASDWPDLDHRPYQCHRQLEESGDYDNDAQMERLLKTLSGGLVEVKREVEKYEGEEFEGEECEWEECTVQLIHQSVNDFLLQSGLQVLERSDDNAIDEECGSERAIGRAHHRLARACINYATLGDEQRVARTRQTQQFPFLTYAVTSWVWHIERAAANGISQHDLAMRFQWPIDDIFQYWIDTYWTIDPRSGECPDKRASLLHVISEHGILSAVGALLGQEAIDVDSLDSKKRIPLSHAAENGHAEVVQALLDSGADPNCKDRKGRTALWYAIWNGHAEVVQLLLERDVDSNNTEKNVRMSLWFAARKGYEEVVKVILKKGFDINAKDNDGRTLLWHAAGQGHTGVVKMLLDHAAVTDLKDNDHKTPLSLAADNGYVDVVTLLLRHEVDVDSRDIRGRTPLSLAAGNGHAAVVDLLLTKNVDVDSRDRNDRTPLWYSALNGHELVVKLLLENGANVKARDKRGVTPVVCAERRKHQGVVNLLAVEDINADS